MTGSGYEMQKSIEVEYWVVDRDGALTTPDPFADELTFAEEEFVYPVLELKTDPCESYAELRSEFVDKLDAALSSADGHDKLLVPFGTPINGDPVGRRPSERARIQQRVVGEDFAYAKYCAGTHLHFEQRNVTDQLNVLAALDPALALLSSSPYFRGDRVANGARSYVYRRQCYEGFPRHGQLWSYVDTVGQWKRRLERAYEQFVEMAVDAGVAEAEVDDLFSTDDVVWTPVRLRDEMPTVEWRSPDATLPSQILRLVEELDAMMERIHDCEVTVDGTTGEVTDECITIPEFDAVCDYTEEAIEDGLESADVAAYLERMGFDVEGYDPITREIDGRDHVSPEEARELRLRYATRLRQDVDDLLSVRDGE